MPGSAPQTLDSRCAGKNRGSEWNKGMEKVSGYVDHIIYRNEDNGYTVLVLICEGEEITCVGTLQFASEGELIEAEGSYTEHSTYGRQFQIASYEYKTPEDELSIERYLGSGAVKLSLIHISEPTRRS